MQQNILVKLSSKGQIVIPKNIRKKLKINPGDMVLITEKESSVLIENPAKYSESTKGSLKKTWGRTKEEVASYLDREKQSWSED